MGPPLLFSGLRRAAGYAALFILSPAPRRISQLLRGLLNVRSASNEILHRRRNIALQMHLLATTYELQDEALWSTGPPFLLQPRH
jgi:hypothetical protein